jgi:cytosine/adenosine deaminase-related metal-dependent hydrolase
VEAGRTVALEPCAADAPDLLDAVLLPGLVNAHTHLDLGGAESIAAGGSFPDWLLGVGVVRGAAGRDVVGEARRQAEQLARRGVTLAGDVDGSHGDGSRGRRAAALPGLSFLEIVCVNAESARARLAQSLLLVDRLGGVPAGMGLSPHAPYSVHHAVVPEIVRAATRRGLPLAMHLAESEEETRYLLQGDGPFEAFLAAIDRGRPFTRPPGLRPVAWADAVGLLQAGCLVIHGNDVDDADIACLARRGSSVVYCHGTHRHFDRRRHRLLDMVAAGVNVALGTDSGLSNRGVDLFAELCRLAADRPEVDPLLLLRLGTRGGRLALHAEPDAAQFARGTTADALLVGPAPSDAESSTPLSACEWVVGGRATPVLTFHAGRPMRADGALPAGVAGFLDSVSAHG